MRTTLALLLAAVLAPAADSIRMPRMPEQPAPMPAPPSPDTPMVLTPELLYVIDSDVEVIVTPSRKGYVLITSEAGPLSIKGRFADKPGSFERRDFKGKNVITVEATHAGSVELFVIPKGVTEEKDIIRRLLDVQDGTKPQPPPGPKPPAPGPVTSYRVIFAYESGTPMTAAQNGAMFSKAVEDYLNDNCTKENGSSGWRRFDKDTDASKDSPTMAALWAAVKPQVTGPVLIIEVNGKATILPFPKDAADSLATLKSYRGK